MGVVCMQLDKMGLVVGRWDDDDDQSGRGDEEELMVVCVEAQKGGHVPDM